MRIIVAGGGIAGTTAAVAMRHAGLDVAVYESHAHDATGVGGWLTLASNGIDALDAVGLGERVGRLGFATPQAQMFNHTGRQIGAFPLGAPRPDGLQVRTIRRTDLYETLRAAAAERGVAVHYAKTLTSARRLGDGTVEARFDDGSAAIGDLLVGADGLRSVVRTAIDPNAPAARYGGLLNTGGYAVDPALPDAFRAPTGTMQFRFGRRCFLGYVTAPDGTVWWFANPPSKRELDREALKAIRPEDWRTHLIDLFAGDELPARQLIDATGDVFAGWNTYDFPSVPSWHHDRMVVIGDAAHAMSPASGQGASISIEDAVILAKAVRDHTDIDTALERYEQTRRDRVERAVAQGKHSGDGKAGGPVMRLLRDRVFLPMAMRRMRRTGEDPSTWLYTHHLEWDQPTT